jgi:hypothetical protein
MLLKSLKVVLLAFHSPLKTIHNLSQGLLRGCCTAPLILGQLNNPYNMLTPAILFVVIVGGVVADPLAGTPIKFVLSAKFVIIISLIKY